MNASTTMTLTTATTTAASATLGGITTQLAVVLSAAVNRQLEESAGSMDDSLNISPVTLSSDWSRVVRLLMLASLAVIGSVGNVFMISAIMVEDHLKKRGESAILYSYVDCW